MAMSQEEIGKLVEKLRIKYLEYSEKYNPRWFDPAQFEERFQMAKKNRMNLEGFILAEISNFEKVRERYEKKKEQKSISEKIDRIIESNNARIAVYPETRFHPRAGFEISHLYGAMTELAMHYFAIIWNLVKEQELKGRLAPLEDQLHFLAMPRGAQESKRIEDHCAVLARRDTAEIDIERDKNEYLKESAFLLHDIVDVCDEMIQQRDPAWEVPLRLDKLFVEEKRKKRILQVFSGMTGYGAILQVREYASGIIDNFRLGAFRRRGE